MPHNFPFSAIVGQDEMKLALILTAVDAKIGGVLVFGDRGTGKSTAIRALAGLLPPLQVMTGCPVNSEIAQDVPPWVDTTDGTTKLAPTPVVDLPLGASEDRVVGALDIEHALAHGEKRFEPGLLARANRGFLYIDEVNLLEDHLVDLLLDVAQSGENLLEREGLSIRHPARFVLIGSGNPEEGDLRPQLLDRFGLSVDIRSPKDIETRVTVIERRDTFEQNPEAFCSKWAASENTLRERIVAAKSHRDTLVPSRSILERCASICLALGSDGLRGELTLLRAARAFAAYEGDDKISAYHIDHVAPLALAHRLRRDPLDDVGGVVRVMRALDALAA